MNTRTFEVVPHDVMQAQIAESIAAGQEPDTYIPCMTRTERRAEKRRQDKFDKKLEATGRRS